MGAAADSEDPLVTAYLTELDHQRRASQHTVAAYRRDLALLAGQAAGSSLTTLPTAQIRRFAMQLHGRGLSARSIGRTLSAWRAFFRWLAQRGEIARNPCEGVRAPKTPRLLPKALAVDQTVALLDGEAHGPLALRDRAMFELLYSSGLRLAELVGLDCQGGLGLDLGASEVTVTGKRGKTRIVPLGVHAITAVRAWLAVREELAAPDEPALFVNRNGRRLSPRSVERRLEIWSRNKDIGQRVHPHMLRHSFASHVLQSSGDLRAVQEMLGHANISTTQIYTHLDFQHLARVYDAAHPRARKK